MSIYSGFATRVQQNYYDQLLYNVISTLLTRIIKFYKCQQIKQQSFLNIIDKQYKYLKKLEKRKYMEPKYSELLYYFIAKYQKMRDNQKISRKTQQSQSRSISILDHELQALNQRNLKVLHEQRKEIKSETKLKKHKKKKYPKNFHNTLQRNSQQDPYYTSKKQSQLPGVISHHHFQSPPTHHTNTKYRSNNPSIANSRAGSDGEDDDHEDKYQQKMLNKKPKFRARMFYLDK